MTYTGKMRLHFNRMGAAPLVWCVSTDNWEIAVAGIACSAPVHAVYQPKPVADDEDGKPSAWFEVYGQLTIIASCAHITSVKECGR